MAKGVALIALTLTTGACGSDGGSGDVVYDTIGGIPAVMSSERGVRGGELDWTLTEHLRVSDEDEFEGVTTTFALDVGIMPGGELAVLDAGNHRVLRFDANAEYIGHFGGGGEDPSDIQVPLLLEVADTLVYVIDAGRNALLAYTWDGEFLSDFPLTFEGLVGTTPAFAAGSPDEIYVFAEPAPFVRGSQPDDKGVLFRLDMTGAILDSVLTAPAARWTPIRLPSGSTSFAKPRLMPEPRYSARPGVVAVNAAAGYVIDLRRPNGQPIRRVARQYQPVQVTQEMRDSILNRLAEGPNALPRPALNTVPFAPIVPAIEDLVLDDRGRLWVNVYDPANARRVDVFDEEGRFLGPLSLPERMQLEDVRGDLACGVVSQADGPTEVVCYRVTEPTPAS